MRKNKLCEYKAANLKITANQLIEFCVNEFKKKPSKAQISRTVSSEDTWKDGSRSEVKLSEKIKIDQNANRLEVEVEFGLIWRRSWQRV
jgi:hypothetical protein